MRGGGVQKGLLSVLYSMVLSNNVSNWITNYIHAEVTYNNRTSQFALLKILAH